MFPRVPMKGIAVFPRVPKSLWYHLCFHTKESVPSIKRYCEDTCTRCPARYYVILLETALKVFFIIMNCVYLHGHCSISR